MRVRPARSPRRAPAPRPCRVRRLGCGHAHRGAPDRRRTRRTTRRGAVPRLGRPARARGRPPGLGQPHLPARGRPVGATAERGRLRARGREGAGRPAVPRPAAGRRRPGARGAREPGQGYPFPWSVRRWLDGVPAVQVDDLDHERFAAGVGAVLRQLRSVPATGGPTAGAHSFHRGEHPSVYDAEVRTALDTLGGGGGSGRTGGTVVDRGACEAVWAEALASRWEAPAVWFHGDVLPGNLLVDDTGRLCAVIDFGTCGVGDPACDLVLAWTMLDGPARRVFRRAVDLDDDTWARARGWALWKALIMLAGSAGPGGRDEHERVLAAVLA
nr:phosphotransferase [Curtobacterium flaccumfaciens]